MKKFGKILLVFVAVLFVTGCGCEKKESKQADSAEEIFKNYVIDYYNFAWKKDVLTNVRTITIDTLGKISDGDGHKKYDVSKIKVGDALCSADSYVEITTPDLEKLDEYTVKVFLTCGSYKSEDQKALENAK